MTDDYSPRAQEHAARRDAELARSTTISRLRLATFLTAAACLIWTLSSGATPLFVSTAVALFALFAVLVVWHARVEERAALHDALRLANVRAQARVERRWDDLPAADAPSSIDLAHHPYALDLDLFGRASLFQFLGPAATAPGETRLAEWLTTPAVPDVVRARQDATAELSSMGEWRERLAAYGVLASGVRHKDLETFLVWAEGPPPIARLPLLKAAVTTICASIFILGAMHLLGIGPAGLWIIPAVAGGILSFATAGKVQTAFNRAGAGQDALVRYAALFEHATAARFATGQLRTLQDRLSAGGHAAPVCMRRLNRILGLAEFRTAATLLHIPVQALTLWDFHVLFALEGWRRTAGPRLRGWTDALGELDALSALAWARFDNPDWAIPEITGTPVLSATALGHPLIASDRRVSNDVEVGPPGTLLLITGSNMSGKSTLLRAIGLNTVLAQAGCCVCAARLQMPPADLQSSIRVQDSLELGLSYFMAALARLKGVVDAAEQPRPGRVLIYLLDEVLQGTNSAERDIAVRAVARHLLDAGAIGAMTTHDLNLAGEEPIKSSARLVHFTEIVDEQDQMRFDYKLREGIATSRNALRLMKLIGIDL